MEHWKNLGACSAVALLLSGTAASAEITAEQVWQSWVDYYASLGQTITEGSRAMDGDTLVITDASMGTTTPEGGFTANLPELRFRETGDGKVEVTFPASMPVKITGKNETGTIGEIDLSVVQTGMTMVVSGAPEDMTYDFKADEVGVKVDKTTEDGKDIPLVADVKLKGNTGTYHMTKAGGTTVTSDFATDQVVFNLSGTSPDTPDSSFTASGTLNGMKGTSNTVMPEGIDMTQMHTAMAAGLNIKADMTFADGSYSFDLKDPTQAMSAAVQGAGGSFNVAMSKDGIGYGATGKDAKVSISGATLPFPVDITYAETAFNFLMPVSKGDTAQPFAMLMKVVDLSVSDSLWGMVDPAAQLPHDPATLVVDVSGTTKMLLDLFDPANANGEAMPFDPQELKLNQLQVKAVGAELTGTGAATFETSTGTPMPVGSIDLKLVGANALLDKLVAMGLLPEDQAMGARMMMGMFGQAAGEDTITSKIERREDGGVYANDQRIQ